MSSTPAPSVTVCVSTRNRSQRLPRLIAHLEAQTLPLDQFEVVVVDDGSTDDTWQVLERERGRSPLRLTVIRSPQRRGAAAGRNLSWRAGTGAVCAFTDDDCRPTPRWLEAGLAAMGERHVIGAGRVAPRPEDAARVGPFSRYLLVDRGTHRWWATANLFVRRADLEAVGGLDEQIHIAGEDTDLGLRVLDTGAEPLWIPDALVHHDVEPSRPGRVIREQKRWIDLPGIVGRHPQARRTLLHRRWFWKPTHSRVIVLVLGLIAAPRRPSALLLTVPWLHARLCTHTLPTETMAERVATLPAALVLDGAEVVALARGSAKHRSLVL